MKLLKLTLVPLACLALVSSVSCKPKEEEKEDMGPLQEMGKKADEGIEELQEKMADQAEELGKEIEKAGEKIEKQSKELKEKAADGAEELSKKLREDAKDS